MYDQISPVVAQLIYEARCRASVKAAELARALDVTPAYVSMVESGLRRISQRRADQIAKFLRIDPFCCHCGQPIELDSAA